MIKNIVFDIGKVLIGFDWDAYVRSLFDEQTAEKVSKAMFKSGYWPELDRAVLSVDEILELFYSAGPDVKPQIDEAFGRIGECVAKREWVKGLVTSLKSRGYGVYYLSNMSEHVMASNPEAFAFTDIMDGGVFSCHVHLIKPDPDIYRTFLNKYNLNAEECLFIDDHEENVAAARQLGMKGIRFDSREQMVSDLAKAMTKKISEEEIRELFPARPKDCHKGSFGYVALIGGSLEYSGAIRLASMANSAMRAGAGVASIAAPRSICGIIAGNILEATILPLSDENGELIFSESEFAGICARYDVIAFGMGVGNTAETIKAVEYLLVNYDKTLIVDADGLNAMSELDKGLIRSSKARLVLTPHIKEFSRMSGLSIDDIKADPAGAAASLADELNAVVLLKGSTTFVAAPSDREEKQILYADRGCPGMATAGSGDVLSGILAAICVNADNLCTAAAAGAYINGIAGEIAESKRSDVTMTASDTAMAIAETIEQLIGRNKD